jgi:hypothetical protein
MSAPIIVRIAIEENLDTLVQLNQFVQSVHAELYPDDFRATANIEYMVARARIAHIPVQSEPLHPVRGPHLTPFRVRPNCPP